MPTHRGRCHCGAIEVELETPRAPEAQIIGACQCSFCRKHNVRAFSDAKSRVILTARDPGEVQPYRFGLRTADVIICRRCGVYIAMVLGDGIRTFSTINVDALDERARFSACPVPRDYAAETSKGRVERRRLQWCPTTLVNWPA